MTSLPALDNTGENWIQTILHQKFHLQLKREETWKNLLIGCLHTENNNIKINA